MAPPVPGDQPLDVPVGCLPVSLVGVLLVAPLPSPQLDDLDLSSWLERRVISLHAAPRRATRRSAYGNRDALFHETQAARHEPDKDRAQDVDEVGLVRAAFLLGLARLGAIVLVQVRPRLLPTASVAVVRHDISTQYAVDASARFQREAA